MAAATKSIASVNLTVARETKNTFRYESDADDAAINPLYVQQSAFENGKTENIIAQVFPRLKSKKSGALVQVDLDMARETKNTIRYETDADGAAVNPLYVQKSVGDLPSEITLVLTARK